MNKSSSVLKNKIIQAIIQAHEDEKRKSAEAAKTFKNSKTFPHVIEDELKKIQRIDKILMKLKDFPTSSDRNAIQIREGLILKAKNSYYGEQFYFFLRNTECAYIEVVHENGKIRIYIVSPDHFRPTKIGEIEIYQQGRPDEEFEVQLKALEIF